MNRDNVNDGAESNGIIDPETSDHSPKPPQHQEANMTDEKAEKTPVTPTEPAETDKPKSEKSCRERLLSAQHWLRFLFMVLFGVILCIISYVIVAVVLLQFLWGLITGQGNDRLRDFGSCLSQYIYQILRFLTYNTEDKPFPFADWPESESKNPEQDD